MKDAFSPINLLPAMRFPENQNVLAIRTANEAQVCLPMTNEIAEVKPSGCSARYVDDKNNGAMRNQCSSPFEEEALLEIT